VEAEEVPDEEPRAVPPVARVPVGAPAGGRVDARECGDGALGLRALGQGDRAGMGRFFGRANSCAHGIHSKKGPAGPSRPAAVYSSGSWTVVTIRSASVITQKAAPSGLR